MTPFDEMTPWTVGAEMTSLSTTIASCLPFRRVVTSEKVFAPAEVVVKSICQPGNPPLWLPVPYTAVALLMRSPVMRTGPSRYLSPSCPMKTTVRSFSASKLHCAVACSVGLPHVTGVASNSGVPGARIWSTSRCSSRAVVPITWSRRSCPVFWSWACASSLVRKHPRPFPAELTTQNSRVSCWRAMADSVSFAWASSAKQAPPVSVDRVSPVDPCTQ